MEETSIVNVVIDTTVVVKSLLRPPRHLPGEVYEREVETHWEV